MDIENDKKQDESLSWGQMICSTLAAAFGVQSKRNKERDFNKGDIKKFIVVAIGFTLAFLLGLIYLANTIAAG